LQDYRRKYLFSVYAALNELKTGYDVFGTTDFSLDVYSGKKSIVLRHSSMNVVVVGNFEVTSSSVTPDWPNTGTWYEFYSQTEETVSSTNQAVNLEPGEYRLYSTVKIEKPEWLNTGINDKRVADGFTNIYPNPSTGEFTFAFDNATGEPVEIIIFDMLGNRVAGFENTNGQSFVWNPKNSNGQALKNGFYFARITKGQMNEIIKLIIE
jgi:hypothetical protein